MKLKRWMTLALSGVLAAGTLGYASVPAKADVAYSTEYEITIPSTLEVQNAGWNATTGITAKLGNGEAFDSSKKLTVTAASAHGWTLVSDNNTVGYNLATEGNNDSAYNAQAEVPSWEFAADEITTAGKNKGMGIIVEDYSEKPAGSYQDTVTFTAKVENAARPLAAAFEDGAKFKVGYKWNSSRNTTYLEFTNSGGTYSLTSVSGNNDNNGFNSSTLTVKDGSVLALDVVCQPYGRKMDQFSAQIEFDATYSTYKYSRKGRNFNGIISNSVNETDITNQLSENTN